MQPKDYSNLPPDLAQSLGKIDSKAKDPAQLLQEKVKAEVTTGKEHQMMEAVTAAMGAVSSIMQMKDQLVNTNDKSAESLTEASKQLASAVDSLSKNDSTDQFKGVV